MNVRELIDALSNEVKPCDRQNAQIEIWCGEQEYEIESIAGFSFSPDIAFHIKPTKSPIMKPAIFKKEHYGMIKEVTRKIREGKDALSEL